MSDRPGADDVDERGREPDEEPSEAELDELIEDLAGLEETAESPAERRVLRRTRGALRQVAGRGIFGVDDVAQQIVGGVILSAPFVVTEEVWSLAAAMNGLQWAITVVLVVAVGYGTLYRADEDRDAEREEAIAGLPLRFLSLMLIAYLSVATLAFVLAAPAMFGAGPATTAKAVSIGAIFSVVGAATADSLFG